MTFEVRAKRIVQQSLIVAAAGVFAIVAMAGCRGSSSMETTALSSETQHVFTLDTLDVLPATAGELRLVAAWRINASGIAENTGVYHWADGTNADVEIMCVTPFPRAAVCDRSVPVKLHFGALSACGFNGYDQDTGPLIDWPGCSARVARSPKIKGIFERLRRAIAEAVPWTEGYGVAVDSGGDLERFRRNRSDGLLTASHIGNTAIPAFSHQLD